MAGALLHTLRTVAWLAPLVFAAVTVAVLLFTGEDDDGVEGTPPEPTGTVEASPQAPPTATADPPPGPETTAAEPGASSGGGGPLGGLGSAASIGALAALITALGTAAARVMVAMGQLRLANANAEAIRAGRPPALAPDDEPEPGPPA